MAQKNATYKVYNGSSFDEIMFKTSADQVLYENGKTLKDMKRETLWSGTVWIKNGVMELTEDLENYNSIQIELSADNRTKIFNVNKESENVLTYIRITSLNTCQFANFVIRKENNRSFKLVESKLYNSANINDNWGNNGEVKIIKVTAIREK